MKSRYQSSWLVFLIVSAPGALPGNNALNNSHYIFILCVLSRCNRSLRHKALFFGVSKYAPVRSGSRRRWWPNHLALPCLASSDTELVLHYILLGWGSRTENDDVDATCRYLSAIAELHVFTAGSDTV